MRGALTTLIKQDFLLSRRNGLVLVTVVTLVVIIALYWALPLLMPDDLSLSETQIFLDETSDGSFTRMLKGAGTERLVRTRVEMETRVRESKGTTGIIASGSLEDLRFSLLFNSRPDQKTVQIMEAALRSITASTRNLPLGEPVTITRLRPEAPPVPFNRSMIAILLAFEVMILGFLFVAVTVFGEKKEGSIRAYRVSPSGLTNYVFSKAMVFTSLSTVYGLVMTAGTLGLKVDYLRLSAVLIISCALMTFLGLGIAAFFRNLSEWFVPGVVVLAVNMLSLLPYRIPTYSSKLLTLLPGYTVIFAVNEILFPTGKEGYMARVLLVLGLELLIAAAFALASVRRNMMKEAVR